MSAYVKSTDVNLASNSKFIQVNDGANIGNIRDGWPVAINGIVIGFAKVVNTSATPPTIELYEAYTGSAITGGVLLAFPSQGQLTVIGDRITALTNTYEALANSVSVTPTANSVVKRDASGKVKTANAVDANDAVALGQTGTAFSRNVGTASGNVMEVGAFGLGSAVVTDETDLNSGVYLKSGFYITPTSGLINLPTGYAQSSRLMVMVNGEDPLYIQQILTDRDGRTFIRYAAVPAIDTAIWYEVARVGVNVNFGNVTAASLNVTGSKNFRIDNPANPDEYLYHSAIESDKPRTQYVLHVDVDDSLEATVTLPDWFYPLNGNTCTVFCSPCKHFGAAYGGVLDGVLTITANAEGMYHVLIMAERSDPNVANWKLTELKSVEPIEEEVEQE